MLHVLSFCREGLAYTPSKNNCADVSDEKRENLKAFRDVYLFLEL